MGLRLTVLRYPVFAFSRTFKSKQKPVKLIDTKEDVIEFLDKEKIHMPKLRHTIEEMIKAEAIQSGEKPPKVEKVNLHYLQRRQQRIREKLLKKSEKSLARKQLTSNSLERLDQLPPESQEAQLRK